MKKILLALSLICLNLSATEMTLFLKGGYFRPSDKILRQMYGNGGFLPEVQADIHLSPSFDLFLSGGSFYKKGHSLQSNLFGQQDPTPVQYDSTLRLSGVSTGVKYAFFLRKDLKMYLGVGPKVFFLKTFNASHIVLKNENRRDVSFVGKCGFLFQFARQGFLDVYFDYSYKKMKFDPESRVQLNLDFKPVNAGGLTMGLGLGYDF